MLNPMNSPDMLGFLRKSGGRMTGPLILDDGSTAASLADVGGATSVMSYGALGDNSTDDLAAFNAALAANSRILIPAGTYRLSAMPNFSGHYLESEGATLIIDDIHQSVSQFIDLSYCQGLTIRGKNTYATTLSGVVSVSGSSGAWTCVLTLADASNVVVGDALLIEKVRPGSGRASNFSGRPPLGAVEETFGKTLGRISGSGTAITFSAGDLTTAAANGDIVVARAVALTLSGISALAATASTAYINDFTSINNYYVARAATGTVTCDGTTAVVGVGTQFLTETNIGDLIGAVNGDWGVVTAIADNTHLTTDRDLVAVSGRNYLIKTHGEHHMGCWKVTAKSGNDVTVVNTSYGARNKPPVNNIVSGNVTVIKTVLNAPAGGGVRLKTGSLEMDSLALFGTGAGVGLDMVTALGRPFARLGSKFGLNGFSHLIRLQNGEINAENGIYLSNWTSRGVDLQEASAIQMRTSKINGGVGYGVYCYQHTNADINEACFAGCSLAAVRQEQGAVVTGEYFMETGCGAATGTEGFLSYGNVSSHLVGMCSSKTNGQALVTSNGGLIRASNLAVMCPTLEGININDANIGAEDGQIICPNGSACAIVTDSQADMTNTSFRGGNNAAYGIRALDSNVKVEKCAISMCSDGMRAEKTSRIHGDSVAFSGNTRDAVVIGNLYPEINLTNAIGLVNTSKDLNEWGDDGSGYITDGLGPEATGETQPLVNYGGMNFNGSTTYLDGNALTGIADAKVGTLFVVWRFAGTASASEYLVDNTSEHFALLRLSNGGIRITATNPAGTDVLELNSAVGLASAAGTYAIMASWDLNTAGRGRIWVMPIGSAESSSVTETTYVNDVVDYTTTEWSVGGRYTGASKSTGDGYIVWLDPTAWTEFNTASNRRKFIDVNGIPVFLGSNGELPTGTAPRLFLGYGAGAQWAVNRGLFNTGLFTQNGTIAVAATSLNGQYMTDIAAITAANGGRKSPQHQNFFYDYATQTKVLFDGSSDGYHRHYGQILEGLNGRQHLFYRRAAGPTLTSGDTIYYVYSDDGWATKSTEAVAVAGEAGFSYGSMSACVTPSGRIILIYAKVVIPSASPTIFKMKFSDDDGRSLEDGPDILTVSFAYARAYGGIKIVPGDVGQPYRLAWTPYYQSGSGPATYKVPVWYSEASDDGLVWTEGTAIINDTSGYTETEVIWINGTISFAASRGPNGIQFWKSTDGGASSWTNAGVVRGTGTGDHQVAPTLNKFFYRGDWYLLLSYCDRTADTTVLQIISVADALATGGPAFSDKRQGAADMLNASGYQSFVTKPDGSLYLEGGTAYIEFKEYVGPTYSQARFVRVDLFSLFPAIFSNGGKDTQPLMNYGGMNFNGTTTYLDGNALTGIADGKKGSFFVYLRQANASGSEESYVEATGLGWRVERQTTGNIQVFAENAAGTSILSANTTNTPETAAGNYAIGVSYDMAAGSSSLHIVVNGVDCPLNIATFTDDTIKYTLGEYAIGARETGASRFFSGDMYILFFDPTLAIAFHTASVWQKFVDVNNVPNFLGMNGSLPTGTQPGLFLAYGNSGTWAVNRGSFAATAFTQNGAIADATTTLYGQYMPLATSVSTPPRVVTAAGAVTVGASDYIIIVNKTSGAATTVNLPASPAVGRTLVIKDGKGDANTNNITLTPAAGNIDGAGTLVMNVAYQCEKLIYNGTQWNRC